MKNTRRLLYSSIFITASALAAGYAFAGYWLGSLTAFVWAGVWIASIIRQTFKFSSWALLGFSILAVQAIGINIGTGWLMVTLAACLAGWDLEYLVVRLLDVDDEGIADEIASHHIRQLGLTLGLGLLAGGIALAVQYRINFWLALLLGFLAVVAVTRFIALIRQPRA